MCFNKKLKMGPIEKKRQKPRNDQNLESFFREVQSCDMYAFFALQFA